MIGLIQSRLEVEQALFEFLSAQKKDDFISQLVLDKITERIRHLKHELEHEHQKREKTIKHGHPCRAARYATEAMRRYWLKCHNYCRSVFRVFAKTALQKAAGAE